jgi:hypothetical protein
VVSRKQNFQQKHTKIFRVYTSASTKPQPSFTTGCKKEEWFLVFVQKFTGSMLEGEEKAD